MAVVADAHDNLLRDLSKSTGQALPHWLKLLDDQKKKGIVAALVFLRDEHGMPHEQATAVAYAHSNPALVPREFRQAAAATTTEDSDEEEPVSYYDSDADGERIDNLDLGSDDDDDDEPPAKVVSRSVVVNTKEVSSSSTKSSSSSANSKLKKKKKKRN